MHVVVVGATGNVGTALLRALGREERVTSVLGLARRLPEARFPKVEWATADIATDPVAPHFDAADCIVHLAWQIQPSHDRRRTWLTNVQGSRRVFEAAAEAGAPSLVYASSVGAYAPGPKDRALDESWPTSGIRTSFYSRDKSEVERILDDVERRHRSIRVVRLRPSLVFQRSMGTEVKRLFTGRWVPHRLVSERTVPFVPDMPHLRFQATHSDDVADAYRRAVVGEVDGAFNIAAEPVLDPDRLAALLCARKVPVPEKLARTLVAATWRARLQPTPEGWVDMGLRTPLMDTTRARTELGWHETRSAGDALLEVLRGFNEGAGLPTPPLAAAKPSR